ncbi:MAG: lipopolysaccharide biosynthesis protein [Pontixanthobacter sp.]
MTFAHRLISGTTQLTLSNGVVRLLSIVTMPILTRLLSPSTYGVAALVGTVISLVSVFALAGIDMSYARTYYSVQPPNGAVIEHYCWRFALIAALAMALLTGTVWWFSHRNSSELEEWLAVFLALGILFSVINAMVQTRARLANRYRAMAITLITTGILGPVTSIGIATWWRQDALALLLPLLLGYLAPALLLGTPSIIALAKPPSLTWNEGAALIKIGLAGIVTAPMFWLLSSSDRWFLEHYHGAEAVGVYSIGYSVAIVGMMVNNAVMSVWLPEAVREYEQDPVRAQITLGRLMSRLVAAMALIWLVVAAAGGDIVRWLANERFHAAADIVPYIAGGVFFYGVLHLANAGLLLAKKLKWAALWWFAGGLVCTLLNWVLVPKFGCLGAAITQSISFAFISLGILMTSQALFRIHLDSSRLAVALSIILASGVLMTSPWHVSAPISLLSKIPIGIVISVIVAWLTAPDWCTQGIGYMRQRIFP